MELEDSKYHSFRSYEKLFAPRDSFEMNPRPIYINFQDLDTYDYEFSHREWSSKIRKIICVRFTRDESTIVQDRCPILIFKIYSITITNSLIESERFKILLEMNPRSKIDSDFQVLDANYEFSHLENETRKCYSFRSYEKLLTK